MSNCESILKYTRYALLIAGLFDIRNRTRSSVLYQIWSVFSQAYYSIFAITILVGMKDVLIGDVDEETFNINTQAFLTSFLLLMKLLLTYSRIIRNEVEEVYQFEYDITHDDSECTRIYNSHSRYNYKIFFYYLCMNGTTGYFYMSYAFHEWQLMNVENSTVSKSLIFNGWFPVDLEIPTYFNAVYFYQLIAGFWISWYLLTFDSLFISMVNFATARAAILGYKLEMLEMYSRRRSQSTFHCLRNIVMEHQDLIRYVEDVNESLKWFFFGDFLIKSYHITVSLLNVMNATKEEIVYYFLFLMTLLIQVCLFYYHANELSLESTKMSVRIFKANWYNRSSEVLKSLSIVMVRVQRPLVLTIGNFREINNDLIVDIIKAAYTFILYQKI